ncbi:MAG TPA: hypothetical protein ENF38_01680 [Candidatus Aenigmarchaeota archaeon]|nr:hypothetical protein [Candidatus Aenigmarchaeota archaeon]
MALVWEGMELKDKAKKMRKFGAKDWVVIYYGDMVWTVFLYPEEEKIEKIRGYEYFKDPIAFLTEKFILSVPSPKPSKRRYTTFEKKLRSEILALLEERGICPLSLFYKLINASPQKINEVLSYLFKEEHLIGKIKRGRKIYYFKSPIDLKTTNKNE